jgi:hypothetical protein
MAEDNPYIEENMVLAEQIEENIRNGKYENNQPDDKNREWENESTVIVDKELILKRKYINFNRKE